MTKNLPPPRCLTIAGSDSSGGAGIQADLKTFAALQTYGMSVITSVTAQNTLRVDSSFDLPSDLVAQQIQSVFDDMQPATVKCGMLSNRSTIRAVTESLIRNNHPILIVDPVMISTSEARLLEDDAIDDMKTILFPISHLITPNLSEAAAISGIKVESKAEMIEAATILLKFTNAVLIKGGHLLSDIESSDYLATRSGLKKWFSNKRIDTRNTHGTGCTLSAAIAAYIALGFDLENAIGKARAYLQGAIIGAKDWSFSKGSGPVHHSWADKTYE